MLEIARISKITSFPLKVHFYTLRACSISKHPSSRISPSTTLKSASGTQIPLTFPKATTIEVKEQNWRWLLSFTSIQQFNNPLVLCDQTLEAQLSVKSLRITQGLSSVMFYASYVSSIRRFSISGFFIYAADGRKGGYWSEMNYVSVCFSKIIWMKCWGWYICSLLFIFSVYLTKLSCSMLLKKEQ